MIIGFKKVADGSERFRYFDDGSEVPDEYLQFKILNTIRRDHVDNFIYRLRHDTQTHLAAREKGITDVEYITEQVEAFNEGMGPRNVTDEAVVDFLSKKLAYADNGFVYHESLEYSSRSGFSTNSKELIVSPKGWNRFYLVREFSIGTLRLFCLEDLSQYNKKVYTNSRD